MDIIGKEETMLFAGLLILGYMIAKWTKLDNVDNRYIELILMLVGGVISALMKMDVYYFFTGCLLGIAAAGNYNLINNLSDKIVENLKNGK